MENLDEEWVTSIVQSFQDQVARLMALVETLAQQTMMENKALEEAQAEMGAKIVELQKEK